MDDVRDRPARLRVGVVGAGRVGAVLGAALARAGHDVVAAYAVSDASRRRAADLLPGVPLLPADEVARACELLLLAVPDEALGPLVHGLVTTGAVPAGQLVVHTAGRYGTDVLAPVVPANALPLALHPAMTFAGTSMDLDRVAGVVFGVTAPEPLRPIAEALVVEMGGEPVWVPEPARPAYHAALAHASNHLVTLLVQAQEALRASGVQAPARMLGPLAGAALDNSLRYGDGALTGPVARGDADTVAAHLRALTPYGPEIVGTYVALSRATVARALAHGRLDEGAAAALLDVLAEPPAGDR